ncbi:hypothetical protein LOC67_19305 [Stieleria sp. JC731]|uniref:hypothetical protein n=1 Tax=Stieleria sp. JC731 TaxID=2894195 RepID=UPI001E61C26E|nr:hypothetical protein [Stieleria sp. JC731]MCC9602704.1 hypothetical protein [Stieleria sp. JC731]
MAKHSQRSAHAASVSTFLSADQARRTVQELLDTSLQYCPRTYENDKHWGETKKVWAGVRIGHEGFKITTHRRWKEVKHGLQTKYKIAFPGDDKAPLPVHVDVRSVSPNLTDDASSAKGWKIDCYLITPLDFQARVERWNRGVKFYSVEILGKMKIGLRIDGQLDAYPDYAELPPAIVIDPAVQQAELTLMSLDVDRVSKIGGEVAEQWGELMEKVIRAVLLDDFNEGLAKKLNRAIDKKRDRLRLSISDWMKQINQA